MSDGARNRIVDILLDENSLSQAAPNVEHERRIALFDLKEANTFAVVGEDRGPYTLVLAMTEGRLAFDVNDASGVRVILHHLPMTNLRKFVKDYALICESYHAAIKDAPPSRIEAIDMGRRALHNDAAEFLMKTLEERIALDLETARRLFTLVCALHLRS